MSPDGARRFTHPNPPHVHSQRLHSIRIDLARDLRSSSYSKKSTPRRQAMDLNNGRFH